MPGAADLKNEKAVYWHRELPPLHAEPIGEHTLEVNSMHVPGTLAHRDELWNQCYVDLMSKVIVEVNRAVRELGGDCAHVLGESVDSKRNDVTNEAWLHGAFTYVVCRNPAKTT